MSLPWTLLLPALLLCLILPAAALNGTPPAKQASSAAVPPPAVSAAAAKADDKDEQAAQEQLKGVISVARAWLNRPELQRSYVGLEVMDIPSGRVLFSSNGSRRFVSASIAKVLTTACAFETLGGAYTYRTALVGYGEIRGGKLAGRLELVGSQDPSFAYDNLRQLLSSLQGKLKSITGDIMVAPVPGGGDHFSTEWLIQDWGQEWMPVSSDLVVDRNVVTARDPGRGYPLNVTGADSQPVALIKTLLQSPWASAWVIFNKSNNTVSVYRPEQATSGAFVVGNPTEFNAAIARQILKSQGIKVEARDRDSDVQQDQVVLGDWHSKPLSELLRFTLKESDNLYAQQLLRTLGTQATVTKALEQASLEERGLARLNAWLSGIGVPAGDAILFDGCGLSRKNAIAPHALNVVLRHMAGPLGDGPYMDLLIHEGEGNVRNFRYKTGAMDSVRSISGMVRTSSGHPLAVTAIINDHAPAVRELRTSLNLLITQMQALGKLKLKPAVESSLTRAQRPHAQACPPPSPARHRRHRSRN